MYIRLTRHSTKMSQNGSRIIREDREVPSMSRKNKETKGFILQN